jgi:hypothetical protein
LAEAIHGHRALADGTFALVLVDGAIVSLRRAGDVYDTDYVRQDARFGDPFIRYRRDIGPWAEFATAKPESRSRVEVECDSQGTSYSARWLESDDQGCFDVVSRFTLRDGQLHWSLELVNHGNSPVEIGDLGFGCPMNSVYEWNREVTYSQRVVRHSLVCGHGSFLFWMRCNAAGPYLVMTPGPATHLEYFDTEPQDPGDVHPYNVYIHSAARDDILAAHGTRWRQPRTNLTLAPAGCEGSRREYAFSLAWADGYDGVRGILYDRGLFDVQVCPGMTVSEDMPARLAIRTRNAIAAVEPEYPEQTRVADLGPIVTDTHLYEVHFGRLGENTLTLRGTDGRRMTLEFFVIEPVETLIRKRAQFLIERQQIRDPAKWYDGLISDWNAESRVLLSPDNQDRIPPGRRYMITCDDPGLCRAPFVAAKNVEYPDRQEIQGLERYITRFLWGGLQRTDRETHPYGLYGIHDWKTNRQSDDPGPAGRLHIWRIYDYPHVILLYLCMYRIAKRYPQLCSALPAEEYLRRACGTALAYYTYPLELKDWSPYLTGTYNELVIEELIDEAEQAGLRGQAAAIRLHWEKKVRSFVEGQTNLFGSEYPFDSTGFESTHAFARYALGHVGSGLDLPAEKARAFLERQIELNIACRGWIETAYWLLGSDIRGAGNAFYTLSYMSQMGGWAVMDYALYLAPDPWPYLRLGYASILSSWALANTGTKESNFGYWFPGPDNDGAAAGGFEPAPYGKTWLEQPHHRGAWYYGCEIDLGFSGALRAAACVLAVDPLFGEIAYGGLLRRDGSTVEVHPRDGVRRRFHVLRNQQRVHVLLDRDHFASDSPIVIADELSRLTFVVESAEPAEHQIALHLSGLPQGRYRLEFPGGNPVELDFAAQREHVIPLRMRYDRMTVTVELL